MKTFQLKGTLREELGKKATKSLRKANCIPCEMYGLGENAHFYVEKEAVRKLIYTTEIFLVELTVGEQTYNTIVKDIQFHPVSDAVLHIDFLQVSDNKPVAMEVPVVLQGLAEGVKSGGKLNLEMRYIRVKAMYNVIPEKLFVNVENLGLGKTIQVGDLSFDGLEVLNASNAVVCAVKLTRAARGAAAESKEGAE